MKKKSRYRIFTPNGIDEKIFVNINGQNQYVFIRGKDVDNPIILNLHGGPANPDAFLTYEFAKEISEDFTYVSWDQRGCGRTYYKNKSIDPKNTTADFEHAIKDIDELVNYLCKRFKKDKVIIMGHSYGSLLGVHYVAVYPEKVESYIGIGQSVSSIDTQTRNYNEIISLVKQDNKKLIDYTLMSNAYHEEIKFSVPMYFISGEYDKSCSVDLLSKYYETIIAPTKKLVIMKRCGHCPQLDEPILFATEVKKLLQK